MAQAARLRRLGIVVGLVLTISLLGLPGTAQAADADPSDRAITVSPSTNLQPHESVAVHWTGFPAGSTAVVECEADVTSIFDCDLSTLQIVETPPDGTFDATMAARRTIRVGGAIVRCSAAPDVCAIVVANVNDQTIFASRAISFDPSTPIPSPTVTVEPDENLVNQQSLTVTGSGFRPASLVLLSQCGGETDCFVGGPTATVDAAGSFTTTFAARNRASSPNGIVSCLEAPCWLWVVDSGDGEYRVSVPLGFDPNGPAPQVPQISVTPSTQLVDRQVVTVTGTGYDPQVPVSVSQCAPATVFGCGPRSSNFGITDQTGAFSIELRVRRLLGGGGPDGTEILDCAPTGCEVQARSLTVPSSAASVSLEFDPSVPAAPPPTIAAAPTTDLGYRASITVQGEGFSPGEPVYISQCGDDPGGEFGLCVGDAGVVTDDEGSFTTTLIARRFLDFQPERDIVDCAAVAVRCALQVSSDDVFDVLEVALSFDPDAPVPPPPTLSVEPDTGLGYRQPVTVHAAGLAPGDFATLTQCTTRTDEELADLCSGYQPVTVDASGSVDTTFTVRRTVSTGFAPPVDCSVAPGTCWVSIAGSGGGPEHAESPLSFDPDAPIPPPPTLIATPAVGLSAGQTVALEGSGFTPNAPIGYTLCADGALTLNRCDVNRAVFTNADADGTFTGDFAVTPTISTPEGEIDCGAIPGACFIVATNPSDFIENGRAPVSFGPEIGVQDVQVSEDAATVTVALSRPSVREVRVHWATVDGSAVAPTDYEPASGDLVFAPGETTKTITVAIVPDAARDGDLEFSVDLSSPQGASVDPAGSRATVVLPRGDGPDDDRRCDRHHHRWDSRDHWDRRDHDRHDHDGRDRQDRHDHDGRDHRDRDHRDHRDHRDRDRDHRDRY